MVQKKSNFVSKEKRGRSLFSKKDYPAIGVGIVSLFILQPLFEGIAYEVLASHTFNPTLISFLFNPFTHETGFVDQPSLLAVLVCAIVVGAMYPEKGWFNAMISGIIVAVVISLLSIFPLSMATSNPEYILSIVQIIPYYLFISILGGYIGAKISLVKVT
jgi:hypothetical protein